VALASLRQWWHQSGTSLSLTVDVAEGWMLPVMNYGLLRNTSWRRRQHAGQPPHHSRALSLASRSSVPDDAATSPLAEGRPPWDGHCVGRPLRIASRSSRRGSVKVNTGRRRWSAPQNCCWSAAANVLCLATLYPQRHLQLNIVHSKNTRQLKTEASSNKYATSYHEWSSFCRWSQPGRRRDKYMC